MMELHKYPGIWGLPSLSPFCLKVEAYLRMADLPYRVVIENNPRRGPKGKFPVLQDGGQRIADSSFIIDYLNRCYAPAMICSDPVALAMQRMIEEHLYFIILYSRWIDTEGIKVIHAAFAPFFPKPLAFLALKWIRKQLHKQGHMQGIARHSKKEIYTQGVQDIDAIAGWLGDKPYGVGSQYSSIDATVFAFLRTIELTPLENPLKFAVQKHANLLNYCQRIHQRWW